MDLLRRKKPEPGQTLQDAMRRREEIAASLPALRESEFAVRARLESSAAELRLVEDEALIGIVSDSTLSDKRAEHAALATEERKAAAAVANANRDLGRLIAIIVRLKAEANAPRCAELQAKYRPLLEALREKLAACVEANEAVLAFYGAAQAEFPDVITRGGDSRGYPVAAGLEAFGWREFRHDANATDGGRLGAWLKRVEAFLNPAAVAPPKPKPKRQPPLQPQPSLQPGDRSTGLDRITGLDPVSAMRARQVEGRS